MRSVPSLSVVVLLSLTLSVPLVAQRGGGGRGGGRAMEAPTLSAYESPANAISFPVPPDVSLFTPEQPGRFDQVFRKGYIAYLHNLVGKDITIGVKAIPGMAEADLRGLLQTLQTNPPQGNQPGFKKVSANAVKIGAGGEKDAVDYVYTTLNKDVEMTTRQVSAVHKGKGFVFTCIAPTKDFDAVNRKTFDRLFATLRFD